MPVQTQNLISVEGRQFDADTLTFSDLRWQYAVGRSYTEGSGINRKTTYQSGVSTPIGIIEQSQWVALVRNLIEQAGEKHLYENMLSWVKSNCAWLSNNERNAQIYALELHTDRIFDNPKWVGFLPFNEKYRPDALCRHQAEQEDSSCCTSK